MRRRGLYADERRHAHRTLDGAKLALLARGKALARETRQSDGRRRMATPLQAEGFSVGRSQARRLRHEAGVAVRHPRARGPGTTDSRQGYGVADKVLARQFAVAKPEQAWAGDITDIWTAEGGFYLSVRLEVYSRKVVGWAMSSHIDGAVVQHALERARGRRRPSPGLRHHADRGRQYASDGYRHRLADYGLICRMRGKGECLDNAVAERLFGSGKRAWTSPGDDATRQEAKDDSMAYIEMFYHRRRKHASLGYVSPNDDEKGALVASLCVLFSLTRTALICAGGPPQAGMRGAMSRW